MIAHAKKSEAQKRADVGLPADAELVQPLTSGGEIFLSASQLEMLAEKVATKVLARTDRRYGTKTVTKTEASRLMGVSRGTVYAMIASGRLRETSGGRVTRESVQMVNAGGRR